MTEVDIRYSAPVRALLPSHWEYHFLQGPLECGPAPGIGEIYPGQKYNCWFHVSSLIEFQSVHNFLEDLKEEEVPFDMAWGFSAVCWTTTYHLVLFIHSSHLPLCPVSPSCFPPRSQPRKHKAIHP